MIEMVAFLLTVCVAVPICVALAVEWVVEAKRKWRDNKVLAIGSIIYALIIILLSVCIAYLMCRGIALLSR